MRYADGLELKATLPAPTVRQLNDPATRETLMKEIRKNYDTCQVKDTPVDRSTSVPRQQPPMKARPATIIHRPSQSSSAPSTSTSASPKPISADFADAEISEPSDVEDEFGISQSSWPRAAVILLISLYREHEEDIENPKIRKKDVWSKITFQMRESGYSVSQIQAENKWRSLLRSHKLFIHNKSQSGAKRKTFQYYQEMEDIVANRHDINPPYTAGNGVISAGSSEGSSELDKSLAVKKKYGVKKSVLADQNEAANAELSTTSSAKRRREVRQNKASECDVLKFLKEAEQQRREDYQERERNRDMRAERRDDLLRSLIEKL